MSVEEINLHDWIRRSKAIAWLLEHDQFIRAFVEDARKSPCLAIEIAARHGVLIAEKINSLLPTMEVTQDDLDGGYHLPDQFQFWPVDTNEAALQWAIERWDAEVSSRPEQNIHRRTLDAVWRQVIRYFGGNDDLLCVSRCQPVDTESTGKGE